VHLFHSVHVKLELFVVWCKLAAPTSHCVGAEIKAFETQSNLIDVAGAVHPAYSAEPRGIEQDPAFDDAGFHREAGGGASKIVCSSGHSGTARYKGHCASVLKAKNKALDRYEKLHPLAAATTFRTSW
jgi:hypothetical protein